jgi:hypothetical protein
MPQSCNPICRNIFYTVKIGKEHIPILTKFPPSPKVDEFSTLGGGYLK